MSARHRRRTQILGSHTRAPEQPGGNMTENDQPEYIGVKMGFLGTSSTLIPMDIVSVDQAQSSLTVSQPKDTVKNGPAFDDDREITPEYESEVRSFYGLAATNGGSGSYSDYNGGAATTGATSE